MNEIRSPRSWRGVEDEVVACRRCPRLVRWRERTSREKVRRFAGEAYWGRPVPAFGDPRARLLIVGLAPAAHGANRTGRMFTGDNSGVWLYRALHRAGFANRPASGGPGDGLVLADCLVSAAVRCAPPGNMPSPAERARCAGFLRREIQLLENLRVIIALGGIGFRAVVQALIELGRIPSRPSPRFGHGVLTSTGGLILLASYHPSQQNTFTGRLTEEMFDDVFRVARTRLQRPDSPPSLRDCHG